MKITVPAYYRSFACIGGRCRHSCCKGWEIGIDDESCRKYLAWPGETGELLRRNIDPCGDDGARFRLLPGDRCPFLRNDGLCELICREGEEILCDICRDHPRFCSRFSDHTEMGLGLCCEEAARLVLTYGPKTEWVPLDEDDGEKETALTEDERLLLDVREELTRLSQDRSRPFAERLEAMTEATGLSDRADLAAFSSFLLTLERMDTVWDETLGRLIASPAPTEAELSSLPDLYSEQLAVYLFSRHLPGALEDGDLSGRVLFCLRSVRLLRALWALEARRSGTLTPEAAAELCRLFSSEIEYSDENPGLILDELARERADGNGGSRF